MERRGSLWKWVLAVAVMGFLLRLWLIFGSGTSHHPELFEYDELTRNLLAGKGYVYSHLGTPYRNFYGGFLYIWMTALLYVLFPLRYTAVLVAQSLISSCLGVVIFLIGRQLWNNRAGLLAALFTVSHPGLAYYDTHKLHPLSFDALLTSVAVLTLLRTCRSQRRAVACLSGILLGVAILHRGGLLFLLPFGLLWLWVFGAKEGYLLRRTIAWLVGTMLVLTPWFVRSYHHHGKFVLLTTSAEHLWIGNDSHSYGSALLPSGETVIETSPERFLETLYSKDELGQSALFWQVSLVSIRNDVGGFLRKVVAKFFFFWTVSPTTGLLYPRNYLLTYLGYYGIIALLAMVGTIRLVRGPAGPFSFAGLLLILGVFLSVSTVHSLFYFELRHRWGIEPLLLILCAIGCLPARAKQP